MYDFSKEELDAIITSLIFTQIARPMSARMNSTISSVLMKLEVEEADLNGNS